MVVVRGLIGANVNADIPIFLEQDIADAANINVSKTLLLILFPPRFLSKLGTQPFPIKGYFMKNRTPRLQEARSQVLTYSVSYLTISDTTPH